MTDYDIYVFILCLVVFILLTTLSIFCVSVISKLTLKLINNGVEDKEILKEHNQKRAKKRASKYSKILDCAVSGVVCLVFVVMLLGSVIINCTENSCCGILPTYRVVKTASMEEKNPKNTYLAENKLNNQIQTFDLIKTEKLPDEMDLKLYDIVVYETDGMLIIHRIVEIEEPNENHPDCRHFKLQGDAVEAADRFPVLYEQMKGIYRGERLPFIGSFILFMQSPAGWLCTLLVVFAIIATPILDKKIENAKKARLAVCLKNSQTKYEHENDGELVVTGGRKDD